MANFKSNSRYTNGKKTKNRSDEDFLVLRKSLVLEEAEDDIFVEVNKELVERPDLIAHKAYGNSDLWWAIYEFNNLRDPFFDLTLGAVLRLPSKNRLLEAIGKLGLK